MEQITNLLAITLGAVLANNFIFSQFLGICPFLGVDGKGIQIFPAEFGAGMLTLPVGGFLVLGCLIAAMQYGLSKTKK